MKTYALGEKGEAVAAGFLRKKGYEILASRYRSRYGEIDLIARQKDIIAFVEVKLRKNAGFARAYEAVNADKMEKIKATALKWIAENPGDFQFRFDIIEIYTETKTVNHIENAFV